MEEKELHKRLGRFWVNIKPFIVRRLQQFAIASGILLGALVMIAVWRHGVFVADDIPFSKMAWTLSAGGRRYHMANDYLKDHWQVGMTVEEIVEVLGAPYLDREHWTYALSDRGMGPEVATPLEFANHPRMTIRFRAGVAVRVFGEEALYLHRSTLAPAPIPFDHEEWLKGDYDTRRPMARSLAEDPPFLGASREEIFELLGEPDDRDPRFIEYELGWSIIDPRGLIINIDENGRAIDGKVVEH